MTEDITKHLEFFTNYTKKYVDKYPALQLKYEHSLLVLEHSQKIADSLDISHELKRAILLAALYHDFGRFEQFTKYQTFSDNISENHAYLGVKMLKKIKILNIETSYVKNYCLAAIVLHNKYKLASIVEDNLALVTKLIRDADKVDILRIMSLYLSGQKEDNSVTLNVIDEPTKYSKIIIQDVLNHRVGSYSNLVYFNDFRLLLGTWIDDLYFAQSFQEIRKQKYYDLIFQDLPKNSEISAAIKIIFQKLEEKSCAF